MSRVQTHGIALIVLVGMFTALNIVTGSVAKRLPPTVNMDSWVPMKMGAWTGYSKDADESWHQQLPNANFLVRYYNCGDQTVELLIIQSADPGSFHNPMFCLPGAGFNTINSGVKKLGNGEVSAGEFSKEFERLLVRYWYVAGPKLTPSLWQHKWNMVVNKIQRHPGDNLSFRVTVMPTENESDPDKTANAFTDMVLKELKAKVASGKD
ncbi:MAG: exosortase C-terminal domain/associated protein EpsI [Armatimonadota bacterium]